MFKIKFINLGHNDSLIELASGSKGGGLEQWKSIIKKGYT